MATFNYELSESELNSIARILEKTHADRLMNSESIKAIDDRIKNVAGIFAKTMITDHYFNADVREIIKPLLMEQAKAYINSIPEVVQKTIEEYFKSDNFKRRELNELRKRVEELEAELE